MKMQIIYPNKMQSMSNKVYSEPEILNGTKKDTFIMLLTSLCQIYSNNFHKVKTTGNKRIIRDVHYSLIGHLNTPLRSRQSQRTKTLVKIQDISETYTTCRPHRKTIKLCFSVIKNISIFSKSTCNHCENYPILAQKKVLKFSIKQKCKSHLSNSLQCDKIGN